MWKPGDPIVRRGAYNQRVRDMQSAFVVQDEPQEVALVILPGADCSAPEGHINGKHGTGGQWDRWDDYLSDNWKIHRYIWRANRLSILLQPEKYYASIYFWQVDGNHFLGYSISFQLPFERTEIGFDTLDLELDMVIEASYKWQWKDQADYRDRIERGVILSKWTKAIAGAQQEIFTKLEKRGYPLDGRWLNWMPDPAWPPPWLPANWDKI